MAVTYDTVDGDRTGPKMKAVCSLVESSPRQSMKWVAERVGPNGSLDYGYRTVKRCKHKGLIEIDPEHEAANPHGRGAVVLTDKGWRVLEGPN